MAAAQVDGTRREYDLRTIEEIKELLRDYCNAERPITGARFNQLTASIMWGLNWRQGDSITAMVAMLDLIKDQSESIHELEKRIAFLESRRRRR